MIEKIKNSIIRSKITQRGGGIEIKLDNFGYIGEKMTAYQNYLGGGILGKVCNDCTIKNWTNDGKLCEIAEELKKILFYETNPDDAWGRQTYEQNQKYSESAY